MGIQSVGSGPAPPPTCCVTLGKFLPLSGPQFPSLYSVNTVELDGFLFPAHTSWDLENFQPSPSGRWGEGRNNSNRELKALEESRREVLEFPCISDLHPSPKRVLFPESKPGSMGEGQQSAGPELGSELRIMWQRLLKFFFADLENLKEPYLPFFREAVLRAQEAQAATSHH